MNTDSRRLRYYLILVLPLVAVLLIEGCSPSTADKSAVSSTTDTSAAPSTLPNPMLQGPDYFASKWGKPDRYTYTDAWGSPTLKQQARGVSFTWKINEFTTAEVLFVNNVCHSILYQRRASRWEGEQLERALQANGTGWAETKQNVASVLFGSLMPRAYVSAEGNEAMVFGFSLTIKSRARLDAERERDAAAAAAKAEADRKARY